MTQSILENARPYRLLEYENLVSDIISKSNMHGYEDKMLKYIQYNDEVDRSLNADISLNKKFFNAIQKSNVKYLGLITEPWCLDAVNILSIFRAIEIIHPDIDIMVYMRDSEENLMNQYLTNGSKSIPIVFGLDDSFNEIFRWGPRSTNAKQVFETVRDEEYPVKQKTLTEFYLSDRTMSIQEEWIDLL